MTSFNDAIGSIESGQHYGRLGPVTKSGDRAYGRYQVMGQNIPEWSKAALGRSMTPQEFLTNSQAQDAVFNHRFGNYVQKYGPEGAARAWFAGEGGMNDPGRRDVLGTSVADYANKFNAALGQSRPELPIPQQQAPQSPAGGPMPPFAPNAMASAQPPQPQGPGGPSTNGGIAQPAPAGAPGGPQSFWDMIQAGAAQAPSGLPLFGGQMSGNDLANWWQRQNTQG